ncbi:hypothetical protein [Phytoactinopolyspora mesophila]|uniref:Uncharacterized protein n=1 Tax=Phytoactinopolyspora mesophila TaxID=2650750 RepID=A0A7K3M4Z1_9ACTN|nr:hypothetical protein [Phytoactinopolyspora mesophila]NDL58315.1 hypothetical protein [Phytoactinopolyspora mesophila]
MTTVVLVLLSAAAVVGAALWLVVDRHRDEISTAGTVIAAAVPVLLLAGAGLFALDDTAATGNELHIATVAAVVAAVPGGGLLVTATLRMADRRVRPISAHAARLPPSDRGAGIGPPPPPPSATTPGGPPPPPRMDTVSDPETLRGGATIGALERIAIVVTLLAGWPEGLAIILAVKGFGRYSEMRRPSAPERFIIGTFTSILWAVAVTGVVVALRA